VPRGQRDGSLRPPSLINHVKNTVISDILVVFFPQLSIIFSQNSVLYVLNVCSLTRLKMVVKCDRNEGDGRYVYSTTVLSKQVVIIIAVNSKQPLSPLFVTGCSPF
jgi:hypothetical protein